MRTIMGLLVVLSVGCRDTEPLNGPTTGGVSPNEQPAPYELRGSVSDSAFRPVADVRMEVVDGDRAGVSVMTGRSGNYDFLHSSPARFAFELRRLATSMSSSVTIRALGDKWSNTSDSRCNSVHPTLI